MRYLTDWYRILFGRTFSHRAQRSILNEKLAEILLRQVLKVVAARQISANGELLVLLLNKGKKVRFLMMPDAMQNYLKDSCKTPRYAYQF
ncbi:hypothetical protein ACS0TY_003642 [Phlomoides rotata]